MKRKRAEFYTCNGYKPGNIGCRECLPDPKIREVYAHRGTWKCHHIGARVKNVPWPNIPICVKTDIGSDSKSVAVPSRRNASASLPDDPRDALVEIAIQLRAVSQSPHWMALADECERVAGMGGVEILE